MNKDITVASSTLMKVKEIVDFIYDATLPEEGYKGGFGRYGARFAQIVAILVKRGVLIREGHSEHTRYTWSNKAMAPTKQFYKSVAQELVVGEREHAARTYLNKKKRQIDKPAAAPEAEAAPVVAPAETDEQAVSSTNYEKKDLKFVMGAPYKENPILEPLKNDGRLITDMKHFPHLLNNFTDQELWDELKRRGARIVDGALKIIKEVELK